MKVGYTRITLLIIFSGFQAICGEVKWATFKADSHLNFQIPQELHRLDGSGEGEQKWVHRFASSDGEFQLESIGFNSVADEAKREGMNSRQMILTKWLEPKRSEVTFVHSGQHYLLVVTIDQKTDRKTLQKYWLANDNANGYAVKSLLISYPWSRRTEFDPWLLRIESSWRPSAMWDPPP